MRSHLLNPNSSQYVWDAIWQTDRYANPLERRQRALKRAAAFDLKLLLTAKKFVLDVGCGTGDLLNVIETQNPNLTLYGVDRSATALRLGASRNPNSNVKFVLGAAELLPFAKGQFSS